MRLLNYILCFGVVSALAPAMLVAQEADAKAHAVEKTEEAKEHDGDAEAAPHGNSHGDGHDGHGGHDHIGAKDVNTAAEEFREDLAIFTFLVFLGLMALLTKFAWGPITEALDTRESNIRQDIADTQSAKIKSEKLVAEHEAKLAEANAEVQEIIAEARRDAETTKADILASANSEAEATKQRAASDITQAKDVALKELFDSMSNRVAGATETVLGRSVTGADHERLIEEALAQFAEGAGSKS